MDDTKAGEIVGEMIRISGSTDIVVTIDSMSEWFEGYGKMNSELDAFTQAFLEQRQQTKQLYYSYKGKPNE